MARSRGATRTTSDPLRGLPSARSTMRSSARRAPDAAATSGERARGRTPSREGVQRHAAVICRAQARQASESEYTLGGCQVTGLAGPLRARGGGSIFLQQRRPITFRALMFGLGDGYLSGPRACSRPADGPARGSASAFTCLHDFAEQTSSKRRLSLPSHRLRACFSISGSTPLAGSASSTSPSLPLRGTHRQLMPN